MKTLEDRLTQAGDELRHTADRMPPMHAPRPQWLRSAFAFVAGAAVVVLLVAVPVWFLSGGGEQRDDGLVADTTHQAVGEDAPEGAIPLPEDHRAARLLAEGDLEELKGNCGSGGSLYGPMTTCVVHDGGVLAIVPLTMPADIEARVEISSLDEPVVIPLPHVSSESDLPGVDELFGVPHGGGEFEISLMRNGEDAGADMGGQIPPDGPDESPLGVIPIPADHAAGQLLESGAGRCGDFSLPEGAVMEAQGDGGTGNPFPFAREVCLIWDGGVAAVVALEFPDDSWVRVHSASHPRPLEVTLAAGEGFAFEHAGGELRVEYFRYEDLPEDFGGIGSPDFPGRGVIDIPDDHVALDILEGDPTYSEITTRSVEMRAEHLCGGARSIHYCVIWDDGVVVMIPYSVPDGVTVQMLSEQRSEELDVELVEGSLFAYWVGEGWFSLGLERDGEPLGTTSAEFPNTGGGSRADWHG